MKNLALFVSLAACISIAHAACPVMTSAPEELVKRVSATSSFGQRIYTRYDGPSGVTDRTFSEALAIFKSDLEKHQSAECKSMGATAIINMDVDFDVDFVEQRYFFLATYDLVK
jgi:hypothetical protein